MLGEITAKLPLYGKHLVILRRHACAIAKDANEALKWRDTLQCLSKSLAYVYADILQFCNDVRNLFPARYQGPLRDRRFYPATVLLNSWLRNMPQGPHNSRSLLDAI